MTGAIFRLLAGLCSSHVMKKVVEKSCSLLWCALTSLAGSAPLLTVSGRNYGVLAVD